MKLNNLSALILTFNEAPNLRRTLERLAWIPDVLVVDSFSTDETLEIARAFPNVRVVQRRFDTFAGQCNFGLEQVRTPWVLSLDADYIVDEEFDAEVRALAPTDQTGGYHARFTYCIYGRPLRASLYPPRTVLYRRSCARYQDEGHGHRVLIQGEVLPLASGIQHDDRKPLERWVHEQNRYMVREAANLLATPAAQLKFADRLRLRIVVAPFAVLFYTLFVKGLVWGGWPAWFYVAQRVFAELLLSLRLLEARLKPQSSSSIPPPNPPPSP